MNTTDTQARSRTVRDMLGRTGRGRDEGAEGGFTLIELMVVLLIMAILLAIAIPTFLSVTNGAKKTAIQSDLTNAVESAQALYTRTQAFPTTETKFLAAMQATQTTIKFVKGTLTPTKAKNVVAASIWTNPTSAKGVLVVFAGIDGATGCWTAAVNESNATISDIPPGDSFAGWKYKPLTSNCHPTTNADTLLTNTWKPNFKTVTGVT